MNTMHFLMGSVAPGEKPNFTECFRPPPILIDLDRWMAALGPWPWVMMLAGAGLGMTIWLRRRTEVPRGPFMALAAVYAVLLLFWQFALFMKDEAVTPFKPEIHFAFGQQNLASVLCAFLVIGLGLWLYDFWRRCDGKSRGLIGLTLLLSLWLLITKDLCWSFWARNLSLFLLVGLLILSCLACARTLKNAASFLLLATACHCWLQLIWMFASYQETIRNLGATTGAGKWAAMRCSEWGALSHFFLHCLYALPFIAVGLVLKSRKEPEET